MQRLQTLSVHRGNGKDPNDGAYTNCENTQCWLWPGWQNQLWAGLACWLGFLLHWLFARLALSWVGFGIGWLWIGFAFAGWLFARLALALGWVGFAFLPSWLFAGMSLLWPGSALGWVGFVSVWLWVVYVFPELDFCWLGFWLHELTLGWVSFVLDWLLLSWLLLSHWLSVELAFCFGVAQLWAGFAFCLFGFLVLG